MVSFTEWYKKEYGSEWKEEYADSYSYANIITNKYERWCDEKEIQAQWDI